MSRVHRIPRVAVPAILLLVAGALAAERTPVISVIEVTGLKLIDEDLVRDALGLKVGDALDPVGDQAKLRQAAENVLALGWFVIDQDPAVGSKIEVVPDADRNLELRLTLIENPVIERIDLGGGPLLPADVLAERLPMLRVGRPMNTNTQRLRSFLRDLEALYRERGREVRCELPRPGESPPFAEPTPTGGVVLHLKCTLLGGDETRPVTQPTDQPGPTPGTTETPLIPDDTLRVSAVDVTGLKQIDAAIVQETVQTKANQPFSQDQLAADNDALRALGWFYYSADRERLLSLGYPVPPAAVGSKADRIVDYDQGTVRVVFDMVENPIISEVRITGNTLRTTEQLLAACRYLQPGRVLNTSEERLFGDIDRLLGAYAEAGHIAYVDLQQRDVSLLTPQPDGTVIVNLPVTEAVVGDISFDWGEARPRTSERVFRSYMRTQTGELFDYNKIELDLREISRLDILESFTLRRPENDPDDPRRVNLVFEVVEKQTGQVGAGGGISSRNGLVGFAELSESNLFGLAHRAAGRVEFSGRFNFSGDYFWPLLDGQGTEMRFRLYSTEDRTGISGFGGFGSRRSAFDRRSQGLSVQYSRPLFSDIRGSAQYSLENVSYDRRGSALPNLPPFPFQDLESDTTSSLTFGLTRDTRDLAFDPTRGGYQQGTFEIAGLGGDNNFGKYRFELRQYVPCFGETVEISRRPRSAYVLAMRGVLGFSSGDLPFSQSFQIGGAETLRGYQDDEFFGDRMFLANIELRRQFKNNIGAAVFFDIGRAWRRDEDVDFLGDLASAVGVGVRVLTPIGPIRFDVAFGGDGSRTHFSLLQTF